MSNSSFPPFLKWGNYTSENPDKPDVIELKVSETETFETEYSINVCALIKEKKSWIECNIPLKSHESANISLFNQWNKLAKDKKFKKGAKLYLKTWLGISKNKRKIRRFELSF